MARYRVVRPIEHNQKLYVPATAVSAGSGAEIVVDASGFVELSDQEAAQLTQGQVQPASQGSAQTIGGSSGSPGTATVSSKKSSSKDLGGKGAV
jgi:hypothetical protein